MKLDTTPFGRIVRANWGYWDGVNARKAGRLPVWSNVSAYRSKHPFDAIYGDGFWTGWYGEPAPNKYTMAGVA